MDRKDKLFVVNEVSLQRMELLSCHGRAWRLRSLSSGVRNQKLQQVPLFRGEEEAGPLYVVRNSSVVLLPDSKLVTGNWICVALKHLRFLFVGSPTARMDLLQSFWFRTVSRLSPSAPLVHSIFEMLKTIAWWCCRPHSSHAGWAQNDRELSERIQAPALVWSSEWHTGEIRWLIPCKINADSRLLNSKIIFVSFNRNSTESPITLY